MAKKRGIGITTVERIKMKKKVVFMVWPEGKEPLWYQLLTNPFGDFFRRLNMGLIQKHFFFKYLSIISAIKVEIKSRPKKLISKEINR